MLVSRSRRAAAAVGADESGGRENVGSTARKGTEEKRRRSMKYRKEDRAARE